MEVMAKVNKGPNPDEIPLSIFIRAMALKNLNQDGLVLHRCQYYWNDQQIPQDERILEFRICILMTNRSMKY